MQLMENLLTSQVLGANDLGHYEKCRSAGQVLKAQFSLSPPGFTLDRRVTTAAQKNGIRYERKFQEWLQQTYGHQHVGSPWICFINTTDSGLRWCQPDALLIDIPNGVVTCIEVKLKHTSRAYYQLRKLYEPVLRVLFPPNLWSYRLIEVVCWYDPSTPFPGRYKMIESLDTAFRPNELGIHIWNPRHH